MEEAGPDGAVVPRKVTEVEPEPAYTIAAPRPGSAVQKKAPAAAKEDAKGGGKGGKGGKDGGATEKVPSPPNTLKVYAVADNAKYECEASSRPIVFRPTMMFQTRTFSFPLKNTSKAQLSFAWQVRLASGAVELAGAGPYSVKPERGVVEASQTVDVTVRFSPTEVDDFERILECGIQASLRRRDTSLGEERRGEERGREGGREIIKKSNADKRRCSLSRSPHKINCLPICVRWRYVTSPSSP